MNVQELFQSGMMSELVRARALEGYSKDPVRKLIPIRPQNLKLILVLAAMTCCSDVYIVLNWIRQSQKMSVTQLVIYGEMDPTKLMNLFTQQVKMMYQVLKHLRKQNERTLTKWKIALNKQDYVWPNEFGASCELELLLGKKKPPIVSLITKKKTTNQGIKKISVCHI